MKVVILAGGLGTRISEETHLKPKPMIEIGGKPLIWHIMKLYASYGIIEFIVCCGYKGYQIKEYFINYSAHMSDITVDMCNDSIHVHSRKAEPWKVTLIDTGEETMTGGRLKRVADFLKNDDCFCMTYGDGIGDVDIGGLINFHKEHGKLATLTATQPPGRFGALSLDGSSIKAFEEKPHGDGGWINGGFFVLSPKALDLIDSDQTIWESTPMKLLATHNQFEAFFHHGFWQPMDTLRDKLHLEQVWKSGCAPWKRWV
jgi:glucose-1-phosphate cytidylyltransferase